MPEPTNLATRRPTETGTLVVGNLAIILGWLFKPPAEVAYALAFLIVLLPSAITFVVELRRKARTV